MDKAVKGKCVKAWHSSTRLLGIECKDRTDFTNLYALSLKNYNSYWSCTLTSI